MMNRSTPTKHQHSDRTTAAECRPTYRQVTMQKPIPGKIVVNWDWELMQLKQNPQDTHRWHKLVIASASWVTCACGEQCAIIPRDGSGKPLDPELAKYGVGFNAAIEDQDRATARFYLNKIEERASVLIKEIEAAIAQKGEETHG